MKRIPECPVVYCPAPSSASWHSCLICGAQGVDHHHTSPRGMGGSKSRKMDTAGIVALCHDHHEMVTLRFSDGILKDVYVGGITGKVDLYRVWDIHNETIFEKIIRREEGSAAAVGDNAQVGRRAGSISAAAPPSSPYTTAAQEEVRDAGTPVFLDSDPPAVPAVSSPQPLAGKDSVGWRATDQPEGIPGEITETGLKLKEGLPLEEWMRVGETLARMEGSVGWWLGDWACYGEHRYVDEWSQVVDSLGVSRDRFQKYIWVAGSVRFSSRNPKLTFSHHAAVAPLEQADQEEWLGKAEVDKMAVSQLREAIRGEPMVRLTRYTVAQVRESFREYLKVVEGWEPPPEARCEPIESFCDWLEARNDPR